MAAEAMVSAAVDAFARELRERLRAFEEPAGGLDASRIGLEAADWAAAAVTAAAGTSLLARRIGPVYVADDLRRWLTAPGRRPLTGEAVRKRAKLRQLVGFRTDDGHWAFPAWQFDRVAGRLVPRAEVTALWQRLPHDGFLTAADLAVWMSTRLADLRSTPADRAHSHGRDDAALVHAVARLRARVA